MSMKRLLVLICTAPLAVPLSANAAITFVAAATSADSNTSVTVAEPTGTVQNDVVTTMCTRAEPDGTGFTDPADYAQLDALAFGSTGFTYLGYKVRGADAGSGYTFSHDGASQNMRCTSITWRGVDTSNPLDVAYVRASHYLTDADELKAAQPITTVTNGAWVVLFYHEQSDTSFTAGAPSGYTLRANDQGQAGRTIVAASKEVATAGTETPGVWTHGADLAATAQQATYTIALRPAGAGGSPPEFDVSPTLDDCDADSCTYDFTPDSSADLYWATYAPGATAPSDCPAVQTASGALDDGSASVTGADSVEIPYTLASQSTYFCLSNGDGDSDVESDLARLRDPRSGFAFVTFAAATNICDLDADFDPDCAVGDIFEYETAANENAGCGVEILTDGDVVLTPTVAGDCDGRITFAASFERTQSGDTDGVFTAPTAGKFAGDETLALNDPDVTCTVDDASPIVWDQDEEIPALDLNAFCSHPLGDTLTYTATGDSLPTGLTKTDNLIEGTPTVEDETGVDLEYEACNAFGTCATLALPVAYVVDTWTVPNLVGRTASEAASDICDAAPWRCEDIGFGISGLTCDVGTAGLVLTQDPAASAEAEPFEDITTTLSRTCAAVGTKTLQKLRNAPPKAMRELR